LHKVIIFIIIYIYEIAKYIDIKVHIMALDLEL